MTVHPKTETIPLHDSVSRPALYAVPESHAPDTTHLSVLDQIADYLHNYSFEDYQEHVALLVTTRHQRDNTVRNIRAGYEALPEYRHDIASHKAIKAFIQEQKEELLLGVLADVLDITQHAYAEADPTDLSARVCEANQQAHDLIDKTYSSAASFQRRTRPVEEVLSQLSDLQTTDQSPLEPDTITIPDNLRSTQSEVYRRIKSYTENHTPNNTRGYISMPTGSGKTVIFSEIIKTTPGRTLIVVPLKNLQQQTIDKLRERGFTGTIGLASSHVKDRGQFDVMLTTYHTLVRSYRTPLSGQSKLNPKHYDTVILDEAHHALGEGTEEALNATYQHARWLGFTATEQYNEERAVRRLLPDEVYKMPIAEAAANNLIAPFSVHILNTMSDMSNVRILAHDFDAKGLENALNSLSRNRFIAHAYAKNFAGEHKAVFNTSTVGHAEGVAVALQEEGVPATFMHGQMTQKQQKAIRDALRLGDIQAVAQAKILGEGFDDETISMAVNVSPTLSMVRAVQRSGRALRLNPANPDKFAVVLECIDENYRRWPVLYSAEDAAGCAEAGWQNATLQARANYENLRQKLGAYSVGGTSFITDATEVLDITNRVTAFGATTTLHISDVPEILYNEETRNQLAAETREKIKTTLNPTPTKKPVTKRQRLQHRIPARLLLADEDTHSEDDTGDATASQQTNSKFDYFFHDQGADTVTTARMYDRPLTDFIVHGKKLNADTPINRRDMRRVLQELAGAEVLASPLASYRFQLVQRAFAAGKQLITDDYPVVSGLLETLITEPPQWTKSAVCKSADHLDFFPKRGASTKEQKALCRTCPAQADCLAYALEDGAKNGIWGGASERERRQLRRKIGKKPSVERIAEVVNEFCQEIPNEEDETD